MQKNVRLDSAPERVLEIGVVGFGKLGLLQAALSNALPGSRLAAITDSASKVLSIFQEWKPDVLCFSDHTEMLKNTKLDAVIIATPTHLHVPIAIDTIERGIPVFIEKPLSTDSAQAGPLVKQARKSGVATTMVGYMNRFSDTFRTAREMLHSNVLGKLQTFRATMYISQLLQQGKGWRYDRSKSGGGVLITQNSHLLDLLLWIFGDTSWVSANTRTLYSDEVEDAVHCYLGFKSGLEGWIDTSWSIRHHRTLSTSIEVQGENGTLQFNDDEVKLYLDAPKGGYEKGWTIKKKPDLYEGVSFDVGGPHYSRQLETFLKAVRAGKKTEPDIESAYKVQCLIDSIYRSSAEQGVRTPVEFSL